MAIYEVAVRIDFSGVGSPAYNVWHYRSEDILSEEDFNDGMGTLMAFYSSIATIYPNSVTLTIPERAYRIDGAEVEFLPTSPTVLTGTGTAGESAELLALGISFRTASATRSGHGRKFLGPLKATVVDADGTPENGICDTVRNAANTLINVGRLPDANGAWGVYSRSQHVIRDFVGCSVNPGRFWVMTSRRD